VFSKLFDLSGRVALVTGAGAGFGEAISLAFAEYGCDVVCADINLEAVKGTSAKVAAKGQRSAAIQFDLGKPEDVEGMVDAAVKALGSLDILVNCGGVLQHDPSESLPLETWNRVIDVNLRGTFLCCQFAGRHMLEKGKGCIVNISSISSSAGFPRGVSAYSASKGGIDALTRQLAIEWAARGIRVNSVAPCQFWTPGLQSAVRHSALDLREIMDTWTSNIPLGRLGKTEEIAGPVLFLVSDAACMVTGVTLYVDGGYLAR
jgi:NAD(P)-dependent dehydrogenase (short-subunit alcohol dehydrogenase family)